MWSLLLLFGKVAPGAISAASSITLAASGTLTAPVGLQAAPVQLAISTSATISPAPTYLVAAPATVSISAPSAVLSSAPVVFYASAGLTVSTAGTVTLTARFTAAAGLRWSAAASFVPPTMLVASGITIGTRATITPGPRETSAGITIGGVDVKGRVRMAGLTIHDVLNDAPNTCSLVIEGDGPAVGQSLRITLNEGSRVLFAGQVQTVDQAFESKPTQVAWAVQAIDDTARANYRRPFGTFVDTSATAIAIAMTLKYAPAFSTAGIAPDLPPVSIVFDGADTFIGCLARLANAIGGYCKVEDGRIYLFLVDTAAAPDPIDQVHRFLHTPAIQANVDSSQLRTRVYGKGYGENIQADLAAGEALVPIQDGVTFPPFGGEAIAATTPDGAQSERLAFTGVELQGGGTLVGPGAGPTIAPVLALAPGAGVTNGRHDVAVVFVTATGKSLAGPFASIDVPYFPPPQTAPVASAATNGTGPDQGSHDYATSFVTSFGETTPSPISNAVGTSAAVGQLSPPAAPTPLANGPGSGAVEIGYHVYRMTFVNATGETEMGPSGAVTTQGIGPGNLPPISGPSSGTTGGSLTPGKRYFYTATYITAGGGDSASGGGFNSGQDITLTAGQNAINLGGIPQPFGDQVGLVTGRNIWRHEETFSGSWASGPFFLVATINNTGATTYFDTMAQATAATKPSRDWNHLMTVTTAGPRTIPVSLWTGPAGTTARRLYRTIVGGSGADLFVATISNNTATTYDDTKADAALGAAGPSSNTTGTAVQRVPVSNIPLGPPGTTARSLYRRFNGSGSFRLVTTLANNTATTFTDGVPNSSLGAAALSTPTAVGNQILAAIPVGASAVTQREIYMSPVGTNVRKLALVVPNNTATSATITASDATLGAAAGEPIADTSGLQQPNGQVNPGATLLPVAAAATFLPGGGWVILSGGQVVRYHGISGQTLTGIPASGSGAITTTVLYGSQAIPSPMLVGVTGLGVQVLKGSAVHLWVQRDDVLAQAEQAARAGGDGIVEFLLVDTRRGLESLTARCDADLALFSRPIVTVSYATRDLKTQSGKQITVDLASPRIQETLTIQEVTITEIDLAKGLAPRFMVRASTVRFSLEDTLRRMVAGGQIVGGSS